MKTRNYVIALAACCAIGASSALGQTYSLTDLGYLPNKKEAVSTAAAINNSGQVAGTSGGAAFLFAEEMKEVGQNPDGFSRGFGVDAFGQVVGDSDFAKGGPTYAALFTQKSAYYLGTGPFSRANGINASGQVVGFFAKRLDGEEGRAFLVTTAGGLGAVVDLGTLGGEYAQAWAINDAGFVTGNSRIKGDEATHAFIWHKGTGMLDLGTLSGDFSYGTFINADNHVVGYATIDKNNDRMHAFLHDGNEMLDLGSLGGASMESDRSYALGINVNDEVVGYSYLPDFSGGVDRPIYPQKVAFLYSKTWKGLMINLNDLIGDAAKEYQLESATAINDKGQIVAVAFVQSAGNYHAVLLTPIRKDASMGDGAFSLGR